MSNEESPRTPTSPTSQMYAQFGMMSMQNAPMDVQPTEVAQQQHVPRKQPIHQQQVQPQIHHPHFNQVQQHQRHPSPTQYSMSLPPIHMPMSDQPTPTLGNNIPASFPFRPTDEYGNEYGIDTQGIFSSMGLDLLSNSDPMSMDYPGMD